MKSGLRALLSKIIDYAGLYPPASLPLDEAIRNYARYRSEADAWMLGRFVCTAARLTELEPFVDELFAVGPPLALAVLGCKTKDHVEFADTQAAELAYMGLLLAREAPRAQLDTYEVPLPPDFAYPGGGNLATRVEDIYLALGPDKPFQDLFCEAPPRPDWRSTTTSVIAALATHREGRPLGFKLRCGGSEPAAIPTAEQVAVTLTACRDAGVGLKFTAGLHHPIRHFNTQAQLPMHGFVNVFVAAVLAHARRLTEAQLVPIIEDEDAASFGFDDDGLRWKDATATTEQVVAARRHVVAIGSCSFDEPRDDLRRLGWLD